MIKLSLLFFVIICFCLFFVVILNIGFGKSLPLSIALLFLVSFLCNFFGKLSFYKYILLILILLIAIFLFYRFRKNKDYSSYISLFFNPSLLIFTIFFIYLYLNSLNKGLTNIDDLSYWSPIIKNIVDTNSFLMYRQMASAYPPFTTWTLSLICYMLGGYSEHHLLFGMALLLISFIIPIFDRFKFKKEDILKIIVTLCTVIALTLTVNAIDDQNIFLFNSVYLDWIMALMYAYSFYLIFTFKNTYSDYLNFGIIATAFLFTKQLSLPLFLILVFSLMVKLLITKTIKFKKLLLVVICILVFYIAWNLIYFKYSSRNVISDSIEALDLISKTLFTDKNITTLKDFTNQVFTRNIIFHPFGLSYFTFNSILFVFSLVAVYLGDRKKENYIEAILFYAGSIGYALVMGLSYISMFPDGETIPMFARYMQVYTFAYLTLVVLLYISLNIGVIKRTILLIIVCFFVEPLSINTININNKIEFYETERKEIERFIKEEYKGENILIISQTKLNISGIITSMFKESSYYGVYRLTLTEKPKIELESFVNYLQYFDYIFISDYDDYFAKNYWYKITDLPLYNMTLYKINKSDNGFEFEYVYVWEQ